MDKKKVVGGAGITSGGNVSVRDVSGQVAIGEHIYQINLIYNKLGAINDYDFTKIFSDVLDVNTYTKLAPIKEVKIEEVKYDNNESFWQDIIRNKHFEGEYLTLKEFHLTEWIPLSPGMYFLPESKRQREEAKNYYSPELLEFLPNGKEYMILGGIGSIRLSSKNINSKRYFFLGATSNGITHQGIPVAITEGDYKNLIRKIKDAGGCICDISGSLEVIPKSTSIIQYEGKISKFYLLADKIEFIDFSQKNSLASTIAIMFPSFFNKKPVIFDDYETNLHKSWSFCYFNPSNNESLNKAIQWLNDYARRYSGIEKPPIFSDFDEYFNHFSNPIEFPLKSLGSGNIHVEKIEVYKNFYKLPVNYTIIQEVRMGDVFKNIQNATIINKAVVIESFYKVKKEHDEDVAKALLQIGDFIEKSGNESAGVLFDVFNGELNKTQPDKSYLKKIWKGIEKTLPTIATISEVIAKIAPLF